MRLAVLLSALILMFGLSLPAANATESAAGTNSLDHILLWGRDIDQATAIMTVKLGFQVRPGRNPGGVANRYVRMSDRSYLELLGITRPNPEMDPGMLADQAMLHGGPGSRTFGLRSSALDQARAFLQQQDLAPTAVFSASPTDPDGAGPSKPPRWRLFAFEHQPLSSNLFFIDYAAVNATPTRLADEQVAHEHPNGARELSALWLLSADADADRKQLERMGITGATPVRMPQVSAHGYAVPVGQKRIFVLQPDGPGMAAEALRKSGPQVLGVSIGVADLDRAKRRVERGYEKELARYSGALGDSFLAPTQDDLGLLIEFHALSKSPLKVSR
ncbi:VOC family protein [Dyella tabacisoli]|uniref:VOC family protein n=1 Tax=Dyella tabacisoli TaxID=2282381 RepID=A0A369ULV4_9GAMM|nr:VOC family protein [Dyella tabacisoli]RDD81487.1 VOC family protein [Dyella tabacisoli]